MAISRDLLREIRPFLRRREFISILGPRQSGKTTLLQLIAEELIRDHRAPKDRIVTITFEDRRLLAEFERDPLALVKSYLPSVPKGLPSDRKGLPAYLLIDEFQYLEEGGQRLKLIHDTIKGIKVIVTGSSSLDLRAKAGKFMVGRLVSFRLDPFNFREYLEARNPRLERIYLERRRPLRQGLLEGRWGRAKEGSDPFAEELRQAFEEFCVWGGYPEVVLAEDLAVRKKLLAEIYNQYILKEIKGLLELATERQLLLLSQHLATQTGNLIVYQNLSQACGLDYRNLKKHLQVLQETFVCRELRPFFKNRQKELSKNPKIYFADMGFRNYLLDNMNPLTQRPDAGAMVENVVFIRLNQWLEGAHRVNFWRTKVGAEVDFVIHVSNEIIPVEVKYTRMDDPKLSRSFSSFIETFKPKRGLILTADYWGRTRRGNTQIFFSPVYYL